MIITFEHKKLKQLANDFAKCQKVMGQQRAKYFNKRLQDMLVAETLNDVRFLPGNYHELTGDRKGQWACNLDQPFRLVFRPLESPIPTSADGGYIWSQIKGVIIIEIVNYHGK